MSSEGYPPTIPDVWLERYLLGELPESEAEAIERLLKTDTSLQARLSDLQSSSRQIREEYSAASMSRLIAARFDPTSQADWPRPSFARWWAVPAALAAAVVILLTLPLGGFWPPIVEEPAPTERVKGLEPLLKLYRKTVNGSETLEDGALAREGDLIRVGYRVAIDRFGVILSVDGRGSVTLHLPQAGGRARRLETDALVLLDISYELDDAPRWERFYFITGATPFAVAPVVQAARQIGLDGAIDQPEPLALPKELGQFVVSLSKGNHP
jgi:hypothetical protein